MDENGKMVATKEPGVNSTVCVIRPTSRGSVHAPVVAVADRAAHLILGKPVLQPGA